jgi:hypothetical protein
LNRKQPKLQIVTRISFIGCRNFRDERRGKEMIHQSQKTYIIKLVFEISNPFNQSFNTSLEEERKNLQNEINVVKDNIKTFETSLLLPTMMMA